MHSRTRLRSRLIAALTGCLLVSALVVTPAIGGPRSGLTPEAELFTQVDRSTVWQQVDRFDLDFETFHPQGMALVGDLIFLSSVEIIEAPESYPEPIDGYDRSPGQGRGHVFVITRDGELIKDIDVGEGTIYHPGGIDFDGERLWVPVAEYRPDSRSIIYTIDPDSYRVTEQFRHDDHVGGVVFDQRTHRPTGVSWGSRTLFGWNPKGRLISSVPNPSHFVDYQDCQYAGAGHQLCTGVTTLAGPGASSYELGGAALTELATTEIVHEVPFQLFSTAGHSITRNPVAFEASGRTLRMFAAPDDGEEVAGTQLYVLEARP